MDDEVQTLARFVDAQADSYDVALAELRAGRKRTHWMWYVLPQVRGLGHSHMSYQYGLANRSEARAYYEHPILGSRLVRCVEATLRHRTSTAGEIFGVVDAVKFRSCVTLFAVAAPEEPCFVTALQVFYGGKPDPKTLRVLGMPDASS